MKKRLLSLLLALALVLSLLPAMDLNADALEGWMARARWNGTKIQWIGEKEYDKYILTIFEVTDYQHPRVMFWKGEVYSDGRNYSIESGLKSPSSSFDPESRIYTVEFNKNDFYNERTYYFWLSASGEKKYIESKKLTGAQILSGETCPLFNLTGEVEISGAPAEVGQVLQVESFSAKVWETDEALPDSAFQFQWQQSNDNNSLSWQDISGANGRSFRLDERCANKYIRLIITHANYGGAIRSEAFFVPRMQNNAEVETPELTISAAQLFVLNAKAGQEYYVGLETPEELDCDAVTWDSGPNSDGAYIAADYSASSPLADKEVYVYTRIKKTASSYAGTQVRYSNIFFSTTKLTSYIQMSCENLSRPEGELPRLYDVLKLTVRAFPEGETGFTGIPGSAWGGTEYMNYYADAECTQLINAVTRYSTVYAQPCKRGVDVVLKATYTTPEGWVKEAFCTVSIAGHNGLLPLKELILPELPELMQGTVVKDVPFQTVPENADLSELTLTGNTGKSLQLTLNKEKRTITFDAFSAEVGAYQREFKLDGKSFLPITIEVKPNTLAVKTLALKTNVYTVGAGKDWQTHFDVLVDPDWASADAITWTSSDESLATVKGGVSNYYGRPEYYGSVHILPSSKPGDQVTITVSAGDITDSLTVFFVDSGPNNPFVDVERGKFYYNAVLWAFYHSPDQITNGIDDAHFGPEKTCTRGHIVTFLWRAKGCPEPKTTQSPFVDVTNEKAFYYKAVLWAVENDITTGTDKTHFSPNNGCTRGQVVAFLWRAEGKPAPAKTDNPFVDVESGKFYSDAVLWAYYHEPQVTNGTDATHFGPGKTCTRGQIVTFLWRTQGCP